ncbi:glycosyltransferase [Alkalimonas delamerensis]|uniref:Glycosyltransferase n=1 Tax=Alkalimonas delamerensis TaxID=265981 RepID=A0ABT9GPS9_9GAMM|nr:glycosyltransferase [Alkalimonas delamerensis]MDP4528972.1 glycosyltransferase [Alkalimonas delamerensis]
MKVTEKLAELFQPEWYLQQNPDVAKAGMDPWQHFSRFGFAEGRLPCKLQAAALEQMLWFEPEQAAEKPLQQLVQGEDSKEQAYACWALARWHASYGRWQDALPLLQCWVDNAWHQALPGHHGCWLLLSRALQQQAQQAKAMQCLQQALQVCGELPDLLLAQASLVTGDEKRTLINRIFQQAGLVGLQDSSEPMTLDSLLAEPAIAKPPTSWRHKWLPSPLVSVIVPCFNAQHTIGTALGSLLAQSWPRLEIIVVDDASSDESVAVIKRWAQQDARIRLVQQSENQGAYAARNAGLALAKGSFLTTHDSDDWSHPQKIEYQLQALLTQPKAQASISHWVRTSAELVFERWRPEPGWIYRNTSSLMFRRKVFKQLGFWDRVSVNADTEYLERLLAAFGPRAIVDVLPGIPLSFGRSDSGSLTQQSRTHLRTQFVGVRQRYLAAARAWHASARCAKDLKLPQFPTSFAFAVPALMCRGTKAQREARQLALLRQSALFDASWYGGNYADVTAAGMDPALHYLRYGGQENRDPGPDFSSSGYRLLQPIAADANPLLHYLESMEESLESTEKSAELAADYGTVQQTGQCEVKPDKPWLMLVAHAAGPELYGAERSLLDVLDALQQLGCNVLLTLPGSRCPDYFQQLAARVQQLAVMPYGWWHDGHPESPQTIARFAALLKQYRVQLCYCNTLVLSAPLYAARQLLVPTVVHVRELPEADPALCQQLGADAGRIRQHLLALADGFIANSKRTAAYLDTPERTRVVPNVVDTARFAAIAPRAQQTPLRLGMLSSNLPKKGLQDFIRLSQLLAEQAQDIECWLFGPDNDHVAQYRADQAAGRLPPSLIFAGYSPNPEAALAELDIVVNLSHFEESFGRTVLEAMAARRCVIAYQWGALPELIEHNQSGILVPLGQVDAVAAQVARLIKQPELRLFMQQKAQQQVLNRYHKSCLVNEMKSFLGQALQLSNMESF